MGWKIRGSKPGGSEISRTLPHRPWRPPSLLYNGYRVSFPEVKRLGRGVNHPPTSSAEVKERVKKGKAVPLQAWAGPWGFRYVKAPDFHDVRYYDGGRSSALRTGRLYPRSFLVLLLRGWVDPRAHRFVSSFGKNPQRHHWGSIPRPSD
jgi:hypothetical protein